LNITVADEIQIDGKPMAKVLNDDMPCEAGAEGDYRRHDLKTVIELPMFEYRPWSIDNPRQITTKVTFKSVDAIFNKGWGDPP
jgi:hypothetical protein